MWKKILFRIIAIATTLGIIRFLWWVGWKSIICFLLGMFAMVMIVFYWSWNKKNRVGNFLHVLMEMMSDDSQKKR